MRSLPNLTVVVPSDAIETEKAIRAVADFHGPVYVRLSRLATPLINEDIKYAFKLGKGVLKKEGRDISIFACGIMVGTALEAAKILEKENTAGWPAPRTRKSAGWVLLFLKYL